MKNFLGDDRNDIDDTIKDSTSILISKQFIILDFPSLLMGRCKL